MKVACLVTILAPFVVIRKYAAPVRGCQTLTASSFEHGSTRCETPCNRKLGCKHHCSLQCHAQEETPCHCKKCAVEDDRQLHTQETTRSTSSGGPAPSTRPKPKPASSVQYHQSERKQPDDDLDKENFANLFPNLSNDVRGSEAASDVTPGKPKKPNRDLLVDLLD